MRKIVIFIVGLFLLTGCGGRSFENFRGQGEGITRSLIQEMQKIRTREELLAAGPELTSLFLELASVMQKAKAYQLQHPKEEAPPFTEFNHALSDQLRQELNRLYAIDGGREVMEGYQREGLEALRSGSITSGTSSTSGTASSTSVG